MVRLLAINPNKQIPGPPPTPLKKFRTPHFLLYPPPSNINSDWSFRVSLRLVLSVKFSCIDIRLSQAKNKPPVRVSLRLVMSVKFLSVDTRLSQATNKPPVRVSPRLVLSVKFSCIDTGLSQSTNKPLLYSLVLTPDSHRLLTSPLLGCHLGWSCLLNSPVLTPDSHRLLTSPLLGCHSNWSCLLYFLLY